MTDPGESATPSVVATVLTKLADSSDLTQDASAAILEGLRLDRYKPHPDCPCERCHRVYRTIP